MSLLKPDPSGAAGVSTASTFQTGRSPKKRFIHVASVASKINNYSLSLSLSLDSKYQSVGGEDKAGKPEEAGREPPEGMGPAHTNRDSNPARGEETQLGCDIPSLTTPPHTLPKKAVWKVLVAARGGRINSLKPEGHFAFVCSVLSPWLLWGRESWCKITRKKSCLPPNSGYLAPEGCLLRLCGKPGPRRAGSQAETRAASGFWSPAPRRYQNVHLWKEAARPDPARALRLLCRHSLPMWLLGEARGF